MKEVGRGVSSMFHDPWYDDDKLWTCTTFSYGKKLLQSCYLYMLRWHFCLNFQHIRSQITASLLKSEPILLLCRVQSLSAAGLRYGLSRNSISWDLWSSHELIKTVKFNMMSIAIEFISNLIARLGKKKKTN